MSRRVRELLTSGLAELRCEPIGKRIRAVLDGGPVVDSTRAVLVWEPRRVVPSYAVPVADVAGGLVLAGRGAGAADDVGVPLPDVSHRPVLDPSVPFAVHSAAGTVVDLSADGRVLRGAGLLPDDPDLAGYVVLDFTAFDAWWEEDEPNVGHPRDPFHRIDVLASSRAVRLELDGVLLAASSRPLVLFETMLPARFYLPPDDVRVELVPSPTRSICAYKGQASYWSAVLAGSPVPDLAWSYPDPLREAGQVRGLVAFFDERVDVEVDGRRVARPITPWSPRAAG
jgi:uncharacterized protein (DUF427 family)